MGLIGEEDLITKDSPNKEDTEWHEHAQSQSVAAITYIDQDITRFSVFSSLRLFSPYCQFDNIV